MGKKRDVAKRLEADVARLQSEFIRVDTYLRTRISRLEKTAAEVQALVRTATETTAAPPVPTTPTPAPVRRPPPAVVVSPAKKAIANWPAVTRTYLAPTAPL